MADRIVFVLVAGLVGWCGAIEDHYATLGVRKSATAQEIRSQYRNLAKKYHPDKNRGDAKAEERFRKIAAAYEVLGDEERRSAYDDERRRPRRRPAFDEQHFAPRRVIRVVRNGRIFEVPLEDFDRFAGFEQPRFRRDEYSWTVDLSFALQFLVFGILMVFALSSIGSSETAQPAPRRPAVSADSTVRELKLEAQRRGLDITGCAEKSDLITLLGFAS